MADAGTDPDAGAPAPELQSAALQTIVCCSDLERARSFYCGVLGLEISSERFNGLVLNAGGSALWLCPVPDFEPWNHTSFGFEVENLSIILRDLESRGLCCERHAHLPHHNDGSVIAPDGSRIAWFKDPDGNMFSVVQPAYRKA
jgi:catechol 2,3-dioxygenase-like lactoylglutathione lyase family enzyme